MRDKISHPDVSMLSRTGTMYNGQGNLSNPIFHQSGDFPKTGNNLRHGGVTHSNNNELVQQQICTDDNGDDEFSDFQSAPTVSVSSAGSQLNKFPAGQVHQFVYNNHVQHPPPALNPTRMAMNPLDRMVAPVNHGAGRGRIKESVVGCRLANYDLASPQHRNQEAPQMCPLQPQSIGSTPTRHRSTGGDGLLIGEEDKYSALRGLVLDDPVSEPSIFDSAVPEICNTPKSIRNVEHKISLVSDDVIEVVKTETTDSADFGEFQSFGAESERYSYPPQPLPSQSIGIGSSSISFSPSTRIDNFVSNIPEPSVPQPVIGSSIVQNHVDDLLNLNFAFSSQQFSQNLPSASISSSGESESLQIPSPSTSALCNNATLSDGEFGDFVGFSETVASKPVIPVVPASPKIVLKTDIPRKIAGKSKKSTHSSGKAAANRIAKASCILTESPTFPKPEENKASTLNPVASIPYEPSAVLPGTFTTDLDDLFDLKLCPASVENPINCDPSERTDLSVYNPLEIDFGAPPKASFGSSLNDLDDFGDFATVPQLTTSDSTLKSNNLDLLALTKRKTHSPAETQSLASLDLGMYVESCEGKPSEENGASPEINTNLEFDAYMKADGDEILGSDSPNSGTDRVPHFQLPEEGSPVVQLPSAQSDDKYSCFKEEIENERERCTTEWTRCLTSCLKLINQAHSILNSASSSEVVREIVSNDKGHSYVLNLIEVYCVARRVHQSWLKVGGGMRVKQLFDDVLAAWESLATFFLGTPLMETVAKLEDTQDNACPDAQKVCGVCLIGSPSDGILEGLLDYGGKCYHATCANMWINQVDSILPSLYCVSAL